MSVTPCRKAYELQAYICYVHCMQPCVDQTRCMHRLGTAYNASLERFKANGISAEISTQMSHSRLKHNQIVDVCIYTFLI